MKIPFCFVIGGKEVEAGTVAVREHLKGNTGAKPFCPDVGLF
jgi:threonyl-tRNA synthetase